LRYGTSVYNGTIASYEIISTDPSTLPEDYLKEVQKRLIGGNSTVQDKIYQNELRKRKKLYEIYDKHNPTKPAGGNDASVIPKNHFELWGNRSYYDEKNDTWWSIEGAGNKRVYHRFSSDNNGAYHWSGSTGKNENRKGTTVDPIPESKVPIEVKRKK
jgi:hypothetical protein